MNRDEARVGARVTWADPNEDDADDVGTVVEPTAEEIAYCRGAYGPDLHRTHLLVRWDGEEDWEGAWFDPAHLRLVPDGDQP